MRRVHGAIRWRRVNCYQGSWSPIGLSKLIGRETHALQTDCACQGAADWVPYVPDLMYSARLSSPIEERHVDVNPTLFGLLPEYRCLFLPRLDPGQTEMPVGIGEGVSFKVIQDEPSPQSVCVVLPAEDLHRGVRNRTPARADYSPSHAGVRVHPNPEAQLFAWVQGYRT